MTLFNTLLNSASADTGKVKVEYTGRELYHLCGKNGEYDAKIDVHPSDGTIHYYESKDPYWEDHSHDVFNKYGNYIGGHPDGEKHSWSHRQHD